MAAFECNFEVISASFFTDSSGDLKNNCFEIFHCTIGNYLTLNNPRFLFHATLF